MKKLLILFGLVVLVGCGHSAPREVTVDGLYEKWQQIDDISYEMVVIKSQDETQALPSMKMYSKDKNKSRVEAQLNSTNTVFITNGETDSTWIVDPESQTFVTLGSAQGFGANQQADQVESLYNDLQDNYEIVGYEDMQGRRAVILEGMPSTEDGIASEASLDEIQRQKLWIDTQTAVPLKMQTFDTEGNVDVDIELQNISLQELPDDLFTPPESYTELNSFEFLQQFDVFPTE